jgi:formate hydrogenlyase transcriptional activator
MDFIAPVRGDKKNGTVSSKRVARQVSSLIHRWQSVSQGLLIHFREDLFYRLNVFPIPLPPLRNREGDIPLLVHFLVARFAARTGVQIKSVGKVTMERLNRYSWPGNIRELENVLERAVILSNGPTLEIDSEVFTSATADPSLGSDRSSSATWTVGAGQTRPLESLDSNTRSYILTALEQSGWVIDGPHGAAKILGLHANTLRSRMKKLGITRALHERPR